MTPKIMIILGSGSDIDIAKKSVDILEKLEIPYSLKIASAHRTPHLVRELVIRGEEAGIEVFIGIAGLAAHLPGIIASHTSKPVIGVPVEGKLDGLDALYSTIQLPYPTPVASVGIDRGDNGAILAAQILSVHYPEIKEKLIELRNEYKEKVYKSNEEIPELIKGKYIQNDFLKVDELKISEPDYIDFEVDNVEVPIIVSNYSDITIAKKVAVILDRLKISHDLKVLGPIRQPKRFESYVKSVEESACLFIGISSNASILTGALSSLTTKPIIGVPCNNESGYNSIFSMVNMPPGVPVATVGLNNGRNAAILAGEILAIKDEEVRHILEKTKSKKINV
ncbi:MAG: 5-(carboxyamino)imidazole ribonucleotide mutase [Methanobrevibacter sp.]|uniref:5-(carboxyamino)imidazole ribonucleotide mutase n=1 Tax=Methanobrevibacter sp. TaxID=66852 RepID=UPI0026DF6733|nr:5-(carboxyamino)imidazole ribonucleotide mutase [Methanobrevibacter sp.]MDO5848676.1 5-(carboxyamino)imidazole ribonucleotide mutase [Methanobrevibacter sp.]